MTSASEDRVLVAFHVDLDEADVHQLVAVERFDLDLDVAGGSGLIGTSDERALIGVPGWNVESCQPVAVRQSDILRHDLPAGGPL
jgi:hypothetical protein